jgi:predicted acylesterase/phospholipase RssA
MSKPTPLPPCDLIMKGGVTSGVVYPKMISRLARDFQFKNIGGTSTGAIAAAACAAAELGRQSGRNPQAFTALEQLPEELGNDGQLLGLFQPAPALRPHFRLALAFIGHRSLRRTLWQLVWQVAPMLLWLAITAAACALVAWDWLATICPGSPLSCAWQWRPGCLADSERSVSDQGQVRQSDIFEPSCCVKFRNVVWGVGGEAL